MEGDTGTNERAYTTSEIATMLNIAVPTVRKYAQYLEKAGYVFIKTEKKARLYIERDIMAFRYITELRNKTNIKVEQAASIVIERFGKGEIQSVRGSDTAEIKPYNEQYNELKSIMQEQGELIKGLYDRLDQQQAYIDERLKERDRALMQAMNESLETRKQIAAAEQKRGFFSRLFKK